MLKKQMEEMERDMDRMHEKNKILRKELEEMKVKVGVVHGGKDSEIQTPIGLAKDTRRNKRKEGSNSGKNINGVKRNFQSEITLPDRRMKNTAIREGAQLLPCRKKL